MNDILCFTFIEQLYKARFSKNQVNANISQTPVVLGVCVPSANLNDFLYGDIIMRDV